MRYFWKWAAVTVAVSLTVGTWQSAEASLISAASAASAGRPPTHAPIAYTFFCLKYTGECKSTRQRIVFRGGHVKLSRERWADLKEVNRIVNAGIRPERNMAGLAGEKWLINPESGDCNDYAVSKRHELLARGWPARALLLSEVVTTWGEHHLVLVVRTQAGDLVLDKPRRDAAAGTVP